MAYNILLTDGSLWATVPDGGVTTKSGLTVPGKNKAEYGAIVDTTIVQMTEHFASSSAAPTNPVIGQIFYAKGPIPAASITVAAPHVFDTSSTWKALITQGSDATFGNITVLDDITANNATLGNTLTVGALATFSGGIDLAGTDILNGDQITTSLLSAGNVTASGNVSASNVNASAQVIATGNVVSSANINGVNFNSSGQMIATGNITGGNINTGGQVIATGNVVSSANVNGVNVNGSTSVVTPLLSTGSAATPGTITGAWTLSAGSTLRATYADLAERHHADADYPEGTVVKVGGENEITQTTSKSDLQHVLGVVSRKYAYLMNADAGSDETHPAVACIGRVPVRIIGPISKGQKISCIGNGTAMASITGVGFGWALESNVSEDEKLVMCVIK